MLYLRPYPCVRPGMGTATVDETKLEQAVRTLFPLKPREIITYLDLKRPIYRKTAAYGHFGRSDQEFTWEKTNKATELKNFFAQK